MYFAKLGIKYLIIDKLMSLVKVILGDYDYKDESYHVYNRNISYNCYTNGHDYMLVQLSYVQEGMNSPIKLVNKLICNKCGDKKEIKFHDALHKQENIGA